jgi:hypothetical protein
MSKNKIDRRSFVKGGVTTVVFGAMSLRSGLRQAIAQSRIDKKPLLSEKTLNVALTVPPPPPHARVNRSQLEQELAAGIRRDVKGWVKSRFTLTPVQEEALDTIPPNKLKELDDLLSQAESRGGRLWVSLKPDTGNSTIPQNIRSNFLPPVYKCPTVKVGYSIKDQTVFVQLTW